MTRTVLLVLGLLCLTFVGAFPLWQLDSRSQYTNSDRFSPTSSHVHTNAHLNSPKFTWTLITTIACKEIHDLSNILAYKSWIALNPPPDILYVSSCHPHFAEQATTVSIYDRTSSGLPLFSDMMAISERVSTDLVAWTNADILLAGDVVSAIDLLHNRHFSNESFLWMAVAARWDFSQEDYTTSSVEKEIATHNLDQFFRRRGVLHTQGNLHTIANNRIGILPCT